MVDKPWPTNFSDCPTDVLEPTKPLLRYHQPRECLWINNTLPQNDENVQRFRLLGILLGITVSCLCTLDLRLPKLFFRVSTMNPLTKGAEHHSYTFFLLCYCTDPVDGLHV